MRRFFCMLMISFVVLAVVVTNFRGAPVRAQSAAGQISDQQAQQVQQNCQPVQSILQRLQTTDVATRVNRGQIYENLLNRMINPFDSRVSLDRYDASGLSSAASTISQRFNQFKSDYMTYSDDFSKLLSYNCQADPRGFYNQLVTARNDRTNVSNDINDIKSAIDRYTAAFNLLKTSIEGHS